MKIVFHLELYKLRRHPMTLFIISLCFGFMSLLFYRLCVDYLHLSHQALNTRNVAPSISFEIVKPLCSWTIILLAIVLPLFTTLSFSQEFRQKTFTLWAMSPQSAFTIVMGKCLSLVLLLSLFLAMLVLMIIQLSFSATLMWEMILLSLTMVGLIGWSIICFGLFISCCISQPLLALGVTYAGVLIWMLLEWLNPFGENHKALAKELSLLSHSEHALNGIAYSPDVVYFILTSLFWLCLTLKIIGFRLKSVTT